MGVPVRVVPSLAGLIALGILLLSTTIISIGASSSSSSSSSSTVVSSRSSGNSQETIRNGSRRLEDSEYFQYDLSDYSLRFEKCQFVKMYDDDLAEDEDNASPLALKHFVVYRLCPSGDSCSNGDKCDDTDYGLYTVTVEDYLEITIENQRTAFENMCDNCNEQCNDYGEYCSGCGKLCYQYNNLEASGYIDAAEYTQCQQLEVAQDDDGGNGDDDAEMYWYVGPRCTSGNSITIGVFADENCWEPADDVDVEELLGAKLSYHLLRHTYSSTDHVCLSCAEASDDDDAQAGGDDDVGDDDADADADDVNEMCENLYESSAKCESETGLTSGFIQANRDDGDYENQVENEFMACTFIKSLIWDSYSESGDIIVTEKQDVIIREVTQNQLIFMGLLFTVFGSLIGLIYYFQKKIDETVQPTLFTKSEGLMS